MAEVPMLAHIQPEGSEPVVPPDLGTCRLNIELFIKERDEATADAERQQAGMREVALFRAANYQGLLGNYALPLLNECERLTRIIAAHDAAREDGRCDGLLAHA